MEGCFEHTYFALNSFISFVNHRYNNFREFGGKTRFHVLIAFRYTTLCGRWELFNDAFRCPFHEDTRFLRLMVYVGELDMKNNSAFRFGLLSQTYWSDRVPRTFMLESEI
jgi:hypothetical protein